MKGGDKNEQKKEKAKWELILIKVTVANILIDIVKDVATTLINLFK